MAPMVEMNLIKNIMNMKNKLNISCIRLTLFLTVWSMLCIFQYSDDQRGAEDCRATVGDLCCTTPYYRKSDALKRGQQICYMLAHTDNGRVDGGSRRQSPGSPPEDNRKSAKYNPDVMSDVWRYCMVETPVKYDSNYVKFCNTNHIVNTNNVYGVIVDIQCNTCVNLLSQWGIMKRNNGINDECVERVKALYCKNKAVPGINMYKETKPTIMAYGFAAEIYGIDEMYPSGCVIGIIATQHNLCLKICVFLFMTNDTNELAVICMTVGGHLPSEWDHAGTYTKLHLISRAADGESYRGINQKSVENPRSSDGDAMYVVVMKRWKQREFDRLVKHELLSCDENHEKIYDDGSGLKLTSSQTLSEISWLVLSIGRCHMLYCVICDMVDEYLIYGRNNVGFTCSNIKCTWTDGLSHHKVFRYKGKTSWDILSCTFLYIDSTVLKVFSYSGVSYYCGDRMMQDNIDNEFTCKQILTVLMSCFNFYIVCCNNAKVGISQLTLGVKRTQTWSQCSTWTRPYNLPRGFATKQQSGTCNNENPTEIILYMVVNGNEELWERSRFELKDKCTCHTSMYATTVYIWIEVMICCGPTVLCCLASRLSRRVAMIISKNTKHASKTNVNTDSTYNTVDE